MGIARCSIRKYCIGGFTFLSLYFILNFIPTISHRQRYSWTSKEALKLSVSDIVRINLGVQDERCQIPDIVVNGQPWQQCLEKIKWMSERWKSDECYANNGVNGSLCSILKYLTLQEPHCPTSVSKIRPRSSRQDHLKVPKSNLSHIINFLGDNADMSWMKNRISTMEKLWVKSGANVFQKTFDKLPLRKKKIHLHIGLMDLGIGRDAMNGGPLGELVQWSDLIATLYILGHDIVISSTKRELTYIYTEYIYKNAKTGCQILSHYYAFPFDLVYTDVRGYKVLARMLPKLTAIKCRFRILDSFGTEAKFNTDSTSKENPFGGLEFNLQQFNTMYPHTPDNTFLGFVVENPDLSISESFTPDEKRNIALVYGKDSHFWSESKPFLDIVRQYVSEIHGTVSGNMADVPHYVINNGLLPSNELYNLLRKTKIFIGLGFPFEGPAPIEAIAMGAIFINPKLTENMQNKRVDFFKLKPTHREITSQNPYTEKYIGKPFVYTVNIKNGNEVDKILKTISRQTQPNPYLPYEFSAEGMLERVAMQVEKQNMCNYANFHVLPKHIDDIWPPLSALNVIVAEKISCNDACEKNTWVCEPFFFPVVNTLKAFEDAGISCKYEHYTDRPLTVYPAYHIEEGACCFQTNSLYFSCSDKNEEFNRLCPCRDYTKGQISLCKDCLL